MEKSKLLKVFLVVVVSIALTLTSVQTFAATNFIDITNEATTDTNTASGDTNTNSNTEVIIKVIISASRAFITVVLNTKYMIIGHTIKLINIL